MLARHAITAVYTPNRMMRRLRRTSLAWLIAASVGTQLSAAVAVVRGGESWAIVALLGVGIAINLYTVWLAIEVLRRRH